MKSKKLFLIFNLMVLFLLITFASASRLPTVGADNETWGTVLNDFLSKIAGSDGVQLNETMVNGTNIYSSSITSSHLLDGTIAADDLGADSVADDEIDYSAVTLTDFTNDANFLDKDEGGTIDGNIIINGNLSLIGSYLNATVTNQHLNGSFLPAITNLFDMGSLDFFWNNLFVTKIFSNDWTNVTITESQVSDLQSYLTIETDPTIWGSSFNDTGDSRWGGSAIDTNRTDADIINVASIYNNTGLVFSVNTTSNIMSLGFYNDSEVDDLISGASGGNSSFNQVLTDTLYYSIDNPSKFINITQASAFNETTLVLGVNSSLWDYININEGSWLSTYNETYALNSGSNSSWNQSLADTLYAGIEWAYNQTIVYTHLSNFTDDIGATSTYNETYNSWAYNQTDGYSPTTYNATYNGIVNNNSYLNNNTYNYNQTQDLTEYSKYQFTNNNFNGSGNFTTSGMIGVGIEKPEHMVHVYKKDETTETRFGIIRGDSYFNGSGSLEYNIVLRALAENSGSGSVTSNFGIYTQSINSGTGVTTYGVGGIFNSKLTSDGNITINSGSWSEGYQYGNGHIENNFGVISRAYQGSSSSGTIENNYGFHVRADMRETASGSINNNYGIFISGNNLKDTATGTITKSHGLFIEQPYNQTGNLINSYGMIINGTTTASGEKYSIYVSSPYDNYFLGKVGINTTAPTHELNVVGTINATNYLGDGSQLTGISSSTFNQTYNDINSSRWNFDGGTDVWRIDGKVGVGKIPQVEKFEVLGNIQSTSGIGNISMRATDTWASLQSTGTLYLRPATGSVLLHGSSLAYDLSLYNGEVNSLYLNSDGNSFFNSGNVTIGTTSGKAKFQIGTGTTLEQWVGTTPYVLIQGADNEVDTSAFKIESENLEKLFEVRTIGGATYANVSVGGDLEVTVDADIARDLFVGDDLIVTDDVSADAYTGNSLVAVNDVASGLVIRATKALGDGRIAVAGTNSTYMWLKDNTGSAKFLMRSYASSGVQGYNLAGNYGFLTSTPDDVVEIVGDGTTGLHVSGGTNGRTTQLTAHHLIFNTPTIGGFSMGNFVQNSTDNLGYVSGAYGLDGNAVDYYYYGGSAFDDAGLYIDSDKNVTIETNLKIEDDLYVQDYVGIGAVSDATRLMVYKNIAPDDLGDWDNYQMVIRGSGSTGGQTGILFSSTIDNYGGSAILHEDTGAGTGDLTFWTKRSTSAVPPQETMRLDGSGNVGIGTTAPTHELNVVGNVNVTGTITSTKYVEECYDTSVGASKATITTSNDLDTIKSTYSEIYFFAHTSIHDSSMVIHTEDLDAGGTYEMGKWDTRYVLLTAPSAGNSADWGVSYDGVTISYVRLKGVY